MSVEIQLQILHAGFVLHKVMLKETSGHFSAWFDEKGQIIDAEQILLKGERPVRRNGPTWKKLQRIGRIYFERGISKYEKLPIH